MTDIPRHMADNIAYHLDAVGKHFKQPKITLIVRAPQLDDGDLVMTNDGLEDAIGALERFKERDT